jgi:hypothetical protein
MPKGWRPEPGDIVQHKGVPTAYIAIVDRIEGDQVKYLAVLWKGIHQSSHRGWKSSGPVQEYDFVACCDDSLEPYAGDPEEVWLDFTKWRLLNG